MTKRGELQKHGSEGFALLEAVVALVLLTTTLVLFATSLQLGRRVVQAGRARDQMVEVTAGLDSISSWIATALPLTNPGPNGGAQVRFDGRPDRLSFVALSSGDVFPGGLLAVSIGLDQGGGRPGRIVIGASPLAPGEQEPVAPTETARQVLVRNVLSIEFRYFAYPGDARPAVWSNEWRDAAHLPRLVALKARLLLDGRTHLIDLTFPVHSM